MRIFQNRTFAQFAKKNQIATPAICNAVRELSSGLIHASLGGGVYKQRIPRTGKGKSGGFRTIVFLREGDRLLFVLGFAKSTRSNIDSGELLVLRELAKEFFSYDEAQIATLIKAGALLEIFCKEPL